MTKDDYDIEVAKEYTTLQERIEKLEKENADLKNSCDETQELLDKQIEATYKLDKENEELEKENEEMKKNLGCETCQIHLEYKSLNNRIANLERENTELKAGRDINVFTKQLTKAKEIIKTFLGLAEAFGYSPSMDKFITEAEQFLDEVSKRKKSLRNDRGTYGEVCEGERKWIKKRY